MVAKIHLKSLEYILQRNQFDQSLMNTVQFCKRYIEYAEPYVIVSYANGYLSCRNALCCSAFQCSHLKLIRNYSKRMGSSKKGLLFDIEWQSIIWLIHSFEFSIWCFLMRGAEVLVRHILTLCVCVSVYNTLIAGWSFTWNEEPTEWDSAGRGGGVTQQRMLHA